MSWLIYAILARFFWACSNVMDQYMARYSGHDSIAGLLILQHIFQPPFIIGLFLYIFQTTGAPPILHLYSMLWLGAGVILSFVALVPYFLALKKDDTHNVIPFYELVPVFLAFFSWLLFGDRLVGLQLLGAALVVGGGFLFAWDFKHGHIRRRTLGLMTISSLCYTVYQLGIRYSSHNRSVWSMAFFMSCGFFLGALVILITAPKPRRLFITSIHRSRGKITRCFRAKLDGNDGFYLPDVGLCESTGRRTGRRTVGDAADFRAGDQRAVRPRAAGTLHAAEMGSGDGDQMRAAAGHSMRHRPFEAVMSRALRNPIRIPMVSLRAPL